MHADRPNPGGGFNRDELASFGELLPSRQSMICYAVNCEDFVTIQSSSPSFTNSVLVRPEVCDMVSELRSEVSKAHPQDAAKSLSITRPLIQYEH